MVTYIYPYRNRDIRRVVRSLDSLQNQEDTDFQVIFVDYGSSSEISQDAKCAVENYSFVKYIYSYSEGKPWNRSKALNIGIKNAKTAYILSADIDMIFHSSFNGILRSKVNSEKVTYFKVGYLSRRENFESKEFLPDSFSNKRAKGISLYPKSALKAIHGFDEFFNCWGSEDEDVISRLSFYGLEICYYDQAVLVYHQYHKPFKELKHKLLTEDLCYDQVRFHNDKKRRVNINDKIITVNQDGLWGEIISERDYEKLIATTILRTITSYRTDIDFFLFYELKHLSKGFFGFKFIRFVPKKHITLKSILFRLWTIRNADLKAKEEYSIKEVNDLLLKFLIYQDLDFHISVDLENASLELRIRIKK